MKRRKACPGNQFRCERIRLGKLTPHDAIDISDCRWHTDASACHRPNITRLKTVDFADRIGFSGKSSADESSCKRYLVRKTRNDDSNETTQYVDRRVRTEPRFAIREDFLLNVRTGRGDETCGIF